MQMNIGNLSNREKWVLAIMIGQRFDVGNLSYIFKNLSVLQIEILKKYYKDEEPVFIWGIADETTRNDQDFNIFDNPVIKRLMRRKGGLDVLYKKWHRNGINRYNLPFDNTWT